jgi:hypothetical protein
MGVGLTAEITATTMVKATADMKDMAGTMDIPVGIPVAAAVVPVDTPVAAVVILVDTRAAVVDTPVAVVDTQAADIRAAVDIPPGTGKQQPRNHAAVRP